jgi:hypothetical protein
MEDTALAVFVFDGQKEDLFETLGQWDRDLARASRKPFTKLLAAGRVDAASAEAKSKLLQRSVAFPIVCSRPVPSSTSTARN